MSVQVVDLGAIAARQALVAVLTEALAAFYVRVDVGDLCSYVGSHPLSWGLNEQPTAAFARVDERDIGKLADRILLGGT